MNIEEAVSCLIDCPVTVIVEDLQGNVIARQATGEQTISKDWEGYYHLLGEDLDCKAGVYNPKTQRIRIEGEGKGTMDVLFCKGSENDVTFYQRYQQLPVEKGSTYSFTDNAAILDGVTAFEPTVSLRQSFEDVPSDAYYAEAVSWAVSHDPQITKGTSDTTFSPEDTCTRGQAVTFLWRANGSEKVTDVKNPFTDVKSTDYYYDAVLWALKNNVTNGMTATTFGPNEKCNRGQIVTFLWRSQGEPAANVSVAFTDVPGSAYFYEPVKWAVANDVTKGTSETTFSPNASCTRGQIVTFLYRALAEQK